MANHVAKVGAAWEESRSFLASIGAAILEHPGQGEESLRATKLEAGIAALRKQGKPVPPNMTKWHLRYLENAAKFETAIHNKVLVADQRVMIGSFNLDPRSQYHNLEILVEVKSKTMPDRVAKIAYAEIKKYKYIKTVENGKTIATVPGRPCTTKILSYLLFNLL